VEYLVAYARVIIDREEGIILEGVYFGGVTSTKEEADTIAHQCVNISRSGTTIPKVALLKEPHLMIDALYELTERFETLVGNMQEADTTVSKRFVKRKRNRSKIFQ
jgi:hypothetical protein